MWFGEACLAKEAEPLLQSQRASRFGSFSFEASRTKRRKWNDNLGHNRRFIHFLGCDVDR